MDNTLFIPTLEELSLVKISVTLWSQRRLETYTRKYVKEDVFCKKKKKLPYRMRKALELVTESIYDLEIPSSLITRLIDKSERIGYELFLFMNESCLNCSHLKFFTSDNFSCYDIFNLNLSDDIKWKSNGEIFYTETLSACMKNHPSGSPFLFFLSASQNCDEIIIFDLWEKFAEEQKKQIEDTLILDLCGYNLSSDSKILLSYWLSKLKNSSDVLSGINFRIDNRNTLDYNLLIHSLNSSFRNRVHYFYLNLTDSEKEKFIEVLDISGRKILALEQIKASYKFLEAPILNHRINQFIIDMLSEDSFEYLIDYCISNLMSFGDLHGNIILYLMFLASFDVKKWTLNDLNFYLQLIEFGQFKIVKSLLDEETKKLVREEILSDEALLSRSTNVFINYVQSIHRNGYYDSLVDFFNIVSDDNDLMAVLMIGTEQADIEINNM